MAVALQDHARERATADDEHFLVVLFQFFDQRQEVAVAADDDVGVDVRVGERHFEGVEREVDVGAVLVAARRHVALDEADGVLRERAAVLARAGPVGVRDLRDDLAALLDGVEDDADVELLAEGGLDADFDVVEVDEDSDVETILVGQNESLRNCESVRKLGPSAAGSSQPSFAAVKLNSLRVRRRGIVHHGGGLAVKAAVVTVRERTPSAIRHGNASESSGASGAAQRMRVKLPRCSSSRPLPPRPVTSYFVVLMVCSAPREVSTVSRSRSPVEAMKPSTRSSSFSLIRMHALAGTR